MKGMRVCDMAGLRDGELQAVFSPSLGTEEAPPTWEGAALTKA